MLDRSPMAVAIAEGMDGSGMSWGSAGKAWKLGQMRGRAAAAAIFVPAGAAAAVVSSDGGAASPAAEARRAKAAAEGAGATTCRQNTSSGHMLHIRHSYSINMAEQLHHIKKGDCLC